MKKPLKLRYWLLLGIVAYIVIAIVSAAIFGARSGPAKVITYAAFVALLLEFVVILFVKIISFAQRRRSKMQSVHTEESEVV